MDKRTEHLPLDLSPDERVAAFARLITVDRVDENAFHGHRKPGGVGRIFGGQVVAQALAAAQDTVGEDRRAHSLHAYFLRGGDEDYPIDYAVERDFDGRSIVNRRVIASQNGKPILNLIASFHRHEDGLAHQATMPDVEPPEKLIDEEDLIQHLTGRTSKAFRTRGFELRMPERMRDPSKSKGGEQDYFWMRAVAPLGDDMALHRLALAYLSDYNLISSAWRLHGKEWWLGEIQTASLDHALWFHEDARIDEWICYTIDTPWAGNGRGYVRGQFWTADGRLIASTTQEGIVRLFRKDTKPGT